MPSLIKSRAEVLVNALSYQRAIKTELPYIDGAVWKSLAETVTRTKVWYALKEDGKWYVVPAKWGGYAGMNLAIYHRERVNMDGTRASNAIATLGYYPDPSPRAGPEWSCLNRLAKAAELTLKSSCEVWTIEGERLNEGEKAIAYEIVERSGRLSGEARAFLAARIAA